MASPKVIESLKNVTQSRGYTAAEESTAKEMLARLVPKPTEIKAPPLDPNNPLFKRWRDGFSDNQKGFPSTADYPDWKKPWFT